MKGMTMPRKLVVCAAFNPAPPKQGMETITITVKDAMGKPAKGAAVKVVQHQFIAALGSLARRESPACVVQYVHVTNGTHWETV
jgi:hypothetical protein